MIRNHSRLSFHSLLFRVRQMWREWRIERFRRYSRARIHLDPLHFSFRPSVSRTSQSERVLRENKVPHLFVSHALYYVSEKGRAHEWDGVKQLLR